MSYFNFRYKDKQIFAQYVYNITTKDADNNTIATYSGEFTTMGGSTSAVEDIWQNTTNVQKLLRDGHLVIIRDGVEYNVMGQQLSSLITILPIQNKRGSPALVFFPRLYTFHLTHYTPLLERGRKLIAAQVVE